MSRVIKAQTRRESCPLSVGPVHLDDLAAEGKRTIIFARRRAASILAEAREEAQLVRQEGDRSGHADGFARGLDEGRRQAAEKATELAELAKTVVAELDAARATIAEVLGLVVGDKLVTAKVSPSQLAGLREYFAEFATELVRGGAVELAGDERIARGDVEIVCPDGTYVAHDVRRVEQVAGKVAACGERSRTACGEHSRTACGEHSRTNGAEVGA